jgi:hypothetical protein
MFRYVLAACMFLMAATGFARDGSCYDVTGYTLQCSAKCATTPGSCETVDTRKSSCLLTTGPYPGYGCHSSSEDCCAPTDDDNEAGF